LFLHLQRMKALHIAVICATTLLGCGVNRAESPPASRSTSPSPSPTLSERGLALADLRITRGGKVLLGLVVEVAETPSAQARGLMGVEQLDEDAGMAFLDNAPSRGSFWMKNTLIPLDIAFWDTDEIIVDILEMQPCYTDPCPHYVPRREYVGAVETNIGIMAKHGVAVGDHVELARR
jgi:uncharacterized membrane protein (UPF0127 family)